jgi:GntR family phosphonate transport system transcriptional regulator
MRLERKTGSSLWHQIEDALSSEIAKGRLAPGKRLPAEPELMSRFGVSRFTVRQAVAELEKKGLVRVEQGRGTFVQGNVLTYAISQRTRFSKNLIEQGYDPGHEVLERKSMAATEEIARALKIKVGKPVLHQRGLSTADSSIVSMDSAFFPLDRFPKLESILKRHKTMAAVYASCGIDDYLRLFTRIEARLPLPEEAKALQLPMLVPVLCMTKIDGDPKGNPICLSRSVWCSDRVAFTIGPNMFES